MKVICGIIELFIEPTEAFRFTFDFHLFVIDSFANFFVGLLLLLLFYF
jgi:hypothetical protein